MTLVAVCGLAVCAPSAFAAVPRVGSLPAGVLVPGPGPFAPPTTGDGSAAPLSGGLLDNAVSPIGFGPLNVAVPALGVL
ncbi:hypothetical protein [Streptomyces alanosinicus]|uniref:hypothetical protein n=1 Tax=Streptomyces alanosinicus TaxID=68171 RepID=UPI0016796198|nr:hypothetical protein [Streptomyces alanosinicus]